MDVCCSYNMLIYPVFLDSAENTNRIEFHLILNNWLINMLHMGYRGICDPGWYALYPGGIPFYSSIWVIGAYVTPDGMLLNRFG